MSFKEKYGGFEHVASGEVSEVYLNGRDEIMLVVTDKGSIFGDTNIEIPGKGKIATAIQAQVAFLAEAQWGILTAHYGADTPYELTEPHIFYDIDDYDAVTHADELSERFTIMEYLYMFPIRYIVYGYLYGDIWERYNRGERVICGIELPNGLVYGSKLKKPILMFTAKAPEGEREKNITFEEMAAVLRKTDKIPDAQWAAEAIRDSCIRFYRKASAWAYERGVIIAGTEFRLGISDGDGCIYFGGGFLTLGSSCFWNAETYAPGKKPDSYDERAILDCLATADTNGKVDPTLLSNAIKETRRRYAELYERLSGKTWPKG